MHSLRIPQWYLSASFFLFSLGSYYFYQINLYLFQLIGILFFLLVGNKNSFKLDLNIFVLIAYIFFSSVILSIFNSSHLTLSRILLPVLLFSYCVFLNIFFIQYSYASNRAIYFALSLNLFFFYLQFFCYVIFGIYIDYLEIITGEVQRAFGSTYDLGFYLINFRPTGLFNEPGTYSTWMMLIYIIYKLNLVRLGENKKQLLFDILFTLSVFLTFSIFGFIFLAIYLLSSASNNLKKSYKYLILFSAIYIFYLYINARFSSNIIYARDTSIDFRQMAIILYYNNLDLINIFFGLGVFNDFFLNYNIVGKDLGFLFSALTSTGLIGLILLIKSIYSRKTILYAYPLIIVLCLTKFTYTSALIWFAIYYLVVLKNEKYDYSLAQNDC